jgi:hypothetical protein
VQYLGLDWAYRRAAWCAVGDGGAVSGEGVVAADEDGLARLVLAVGVEGAGVCGDDERRGLGPRPLGGGGLGGAGRASPQGP